MAKGIECTCVVNTRNGYCLTPKKCKSISEAIAWAKDSFGFAYRIFVGNKVVRSGYCD